MVRGWETSSAWQFGKVQATLVHVLDLAQDLHVCSPVRDLPPLPPHVVEAESISVCI